MNEDFIYYFKRYLNQLKTQVAAYPSEESLWLCPEGINNSAGNLAYHICGNLNHFIGNGVGKNGYVRNRDLEFTIKDVPKQELLDWIDQTMAMIEEVLAAPRDLQAAFPKELFNQEGTIAFWMHRLLIHLGYHLGQINYHRRLLTEAKGA